MGPIPNPLDYLVSLYAPHQCVGCGREGEVLCGQCYQALPVPRAGCYQCGKQSARGRTCADCYPDSNLISVNWVTHYVEPAKSLIWHLKFGRAQAAADGMGRRLAELYGDLLPDDVLVVPAPTAMRRIRTRGYDQAALIARSFSRHSGLEYAPLLRRLGSQEQKGANLQQRQVQLQGAFEVKKPQKVLGRRIILIDDVVTTGSTLEEAATILKRQGAKAVGALVFARA